MTLAMKRRHGFKEVYKGLLANVVLSAGGNGVGPLRGGEGGGAGVEEVATHAHGSTGLM